MELFSSISWTAILSSVMGFLNMILKALLVLGIGYLLTMWLLKFTSKALKKANNNETLHKFLLSLIRIVCYVVLIVIALKILGIPTDSLIAAIGTCGVAIGLALKDSLSNFASGVLILFNQPFKAGDFVDIGGTSGVVSEVGLMATKLKTFDNLHIIIPNNTVSSSNVINYSVEKVRRLDMDFNISYDDDADLAMDLIKRAIAAQGMLILNEPGEPFVNVTAFGEHAVTVTMRVWCNASDLWNIKFALMKDVRTAFNNNNIHIPYNQLDVHVVEKK